MKAWKNFDFIAPSSGLYKNVRFFCHIVNFQCDCLFILLPTQMLVWECSYEFVCMRLCVYQWDRQKLERWIERPSNFLFEIGCSPSDKNVGITNKCLSQIGIFWESCIYLGNKIFSFATKNGTLSIIIFTLSLVQMMS